MKYLTVIALCALLLTAWGCQTSHRVEVAPVEVKPIHITIDVNVKVDKELNDFFSDIDKAGATTPEATHENRLVLPIVALALCLAASVALAGGIKDRMVQRKPAIDTLLAQGVIGENNIGLLEYRGAEQNLAVVKEENSDRFTVYKAIAQKTDTDQIVVGQRRAAQIASQAPPGTWLQRPEGTWYQK